MNADQYNNTMNQPPANDYGVQSQTNFDSMYEPIASNSFGGSPF